MKGKEEKDGDGEEEAGGTRLPPHGFQRRIGRGVGGDGGCVTGGGGRVECEGGFYIYTREVKTWDVVIGGRVCLLGFLILTRSPTW